ncbi:MAG: CD1247 N-terminal domain-containing protein [Candidatus Faecivicinus sp.]
MNNMSQKVGYLKGMLEGISPEDASASNKVLRGIVDLLGDLSDRLDTVDELLDDLNDYVESIDDDLSALEDEADGADSSFKLFDDEDEDESDEDFDDDQESAEDQLHLLRPEPASADGDSLAGALCPDCGRMFFVSPSDPGDALYDCPHCGKEIQPVPLTPDNAPIAHPKQR